MKILFLCHRMPYPPDKGDKIRAFHQLRAMAARHDVDVFTLVDDPADLVHCDALRKHCRQLTVERVDPRLAKLRSLPYLLTNTPLTVPYFYSARLRAAVDRAVLSGSYDRIFVYCSAMAQYLPAPETIARLGKPIPVVMDIVDVDSDKWAQYATATGLPYSMVYRREARTLRAYEQRTCEAAACVVVTTEREAVLARQIAPRADVRVISNGVETERFAVERSPAEDVRTVIFTGDMAYFPNADAARFFALDVLPLIRREIPGVRFLVVGRNPGPAVDEIRGIDGVEVTGFVPDVRTWLAKASVAVAPLKIAAGVQNKILEAMASGLPVVATSRTVQGLTDAVRDIVRVADTAEQLASAVVQLLRDPELRHREGAEARRRVTAHYSWEHALQQLLDVIEDPAASAANDSLSAPVRPALAATR